jgi:hypothetical protein
MNWYFRKICQTEMPLNEIVTDQDMADSGSSPMSSLPFGYVVRRDNDGGWTVLNPDGSLLVNTEAEQEGTEVDALRRAIRMALKRLNLLFAENTSLQ